MSKTTDTILAILYQHRDTYVSGQTIASSLNISRTAVKKHIDTLKSDGCAIESVNHRGHRLCALPDKWYPALVTLATTSTLFDQIHVLDRCPSTQQIAKQNLIGNQDSWLIMSNVQTAGHGRFKRPWASAEGKGLWASIVLRPNVPFSMITHFNLFIALGIRDAIQHFVDDPVTVKWPNDIYIHDKKICGFLTEMVANNDGIEAIICGIGINMTQPADAFKSDLLQHATSMQLHRETPLNRYDFLQYLLECIKVRYEAFLTEPFSTIKETYQSVSNIWNRKLKFTENEKQFIGEAIEINDQGYLIVRDQEGVIHQLMSADIEL